MDHQSVDGTNDGNYERCHQKKSEEEKGKQKDQKQLIGYQSKIDDVQIVLKCENRIASVYWTNYWWKIQLVEMHIIMSSLSIKV